MPYGHRRYPNEKGSGGPQLDDIGLGYLLYAADLWLGYGLWGHECVRETSSVWTAGAQTL